jgi:hypothetical protein
MPNNPNTPNERMDPQNKTLVNLQRVHVALQRAIEPFDGGPQDATTDILHMFHGVIGRIMSGVDPKSAFMVGVQTLVPSPMPAAGTPGSAAPQASAGPTPPPSLLQGIQGPVPVSPGVSGGPPMGGPSTPPG